MNKTQMMNEELMDYAICVPRNELPKLLGCGQTTADRIARDAGARVKVGKRVIIKIDKIKQYLEEIAE